MILSKIIDLYLYLANVKNFLEPKLSFKADEYKIYKEEIENNKDINIHYKRVIKAI